MHLDNIVIAEQGKYNSNVGDKQYSAILISLITQPTQSFGDVSGELILLDLAALGLDSIYAIERGTYNLPEIDIPPPDKGRIPPDMIRIPNSPITEKGPVPLRVPWHPDKIPKRRPPRNKRKLPLN